LTLSPEIRGQIGDVFTQQQGGKKRTIKRKAIRKKVVAFRDKANIKTKQRKKTDKKKRI